LSKPVVPHPSSALHLVSPAVENAKESGIRKRTNPRRMGSKP
jgi:hypothetical protein